MEKCKFEEYCNKLSAMAAAAPDWYMRNESIIADYLREPASYGFSFVLVKLSIPAFEILNEYSAANAGVFDSMDLYELAGSLTAKAQIEDYRFAAYYFVMCVLAKTFFSVETDASDIDSFDENELIKFDCSISTVNETDPLKKKLKSYSIRLLDFSRTNQLVHFRPVKSSTMSLVCADVYASLMYIKNKKRVYLSSWKKLKPTALYKCRTCGSIGTNPYDFSAGKIQPQKECRICDSDNTHNRKSMLPIKEKLTVLPESGYLCDCGRRIFAKELNENGFVCPVCGSIIPVEYMPVVDYADIKSYPAGEMLCSVSDAAAQETEKNILNKARNMERNFGLHVLYLACGFLRWKDTNGTEYNSPVLLCPINIGVDKKEGLYYFEADDSQEHTFEVNKTLIQMLSAYSATCSINLPALDESDVASYFAKLKNYFENAGEGISEITKNWRTEISFGIGLFHYQKLQLQHDIEENAGKYLKHPVIRRLCGDEGAETGKPALKERYSAKYLLLDADSSQEQVIKASQEGKSFILQGPPGSGKSQTITNIIASALGEGKSVLFVTEKASARSVITDNLIKCNTGTDKKLTDFVIDFDNFRKRSGAVGRKPFVEELNKYLINYVPSGGYDDGIIDEERLRFDRLSDFIEECIGEHDGYSYIRLLQDPDLPSFSGCKELAEINAVPVDGVKFLSLCDDVSKYYSAAAALKTTDFRKHPLYGLKGDCGGSLLRLAKQYLSLSDNFSDILKKLEACGWTVKRTAESLEKCIDNLKLWPDFPELDKKIIDNLKTGVISDGISALIKSAEARRETQSKLEQYEACEYNIDDDKFSAFDLKNSLEQAKNYRFFFNRMGKEYADWRSGILDCFTNKQEKRGYKSIIALLQQLEEYFAYCELKKANELLKDEDEAVFGERPKSSAEWDILSDKLNKAQKIINLNDKKLLNLADNPQWFENFSSDNYEDSMTHTAALAEKLALYISEEEKLGGELDKYCDKAPDGFLRFKKLSEAAVANGDKLGDWYRLYTAAENLKQNGFITVLYELISDGTATYEEAKARLFRSRFIQRTEYFTVKNDLKYLQSFGRDEHEKLIASYAAADKAILLTSAKRLYDALKGELFKSASAKCGRSAAKAYPKLQSKTGYSIKQTIAENWEYIRHIKPCFMMSPLNVSQYIDADVKFDLVIFDEASQIFTEDALAAIMRGKQVIIAGDSKQLPPCDFFKAGESIRDDDEQYFEEEADKDYSLLTAADEVLSDASISLTWHYRSSDESLIDFSNREMEYNLITFPSARRNENDGIYYVSVPYNSAACYEAGKGGSHINRGEADRIVEIIYEEMTHPERKNFSIGVVAFSNAQADEIEARFDKFKQNADKKTQAIIEEWENLHVGEPLIFCNLDTVQGDERDTTIISVCYSEDKDGKFILPYLGRVRLSSGKKRINVAITRAKHRMIVVSTLTSLRLEEAIRSSSAPDGNKEGAEMLCRFLKYAQSFSDSMDIVSGNTDNPFTLSVCRLLSENNIEYATEIGRSECKINIGIKGDNGNFVLGIIIDDPRRPDFDSVREYARLTEQVLTEKYGWKIYRIFPTAWINDYEREKNRLLETISQCI